MESRTTPIREGEDDEDIAMLDTPSHGLPQVAIRSQLSCHVALGFSRHVVTVSVITFSYDIETGRYALERGRRRRRFGSGPSSRRSMDHSV